MVWPTTIAAPSATVAPLGRTRWRYPVAPPVGEWGMEISDEAFEQIVSEEYNAIPGDMFGSLDNVVILIDNQPPEQRPRLFGLYSGHPLTKRGSYGFGELPDRITLYKNNISAHSASLEELRRRVRITLVHEIGHYFGMDDQRLTELGWA